MSNHDFIAIHDLFTSSSVQLQVVLCLLFLEFLCQLLEPHVVRSIDQPLSQFLLIDLLEGAVLLHGVVTERGQDLEDKVSEIAVAELRIFCALLNKQVWARKSKSTVKS